MDDKDMQAVLEYYILCRYLYRIGKSPLSDSEYDRLHDQIEKHNLLPEYTSRTYDDDPISGYLVDLLVKYGYAPVKLEDNDIPVEDSEFLVEDKSMSIRALKNFGELWDFFKKFKGVPKCASIKLDGDNVKGIIGDGNFKLCLTRGRASKGFNVTEAMRKIYPVGASLPDGCIVRGECFVDPESLEFLRKKYDPDIYKTSKTAAISLLRRPESHMAEDFKHLKFFVFSCDGLATTVYDSYRMLQTSGFDVPPFRMVPDGEPETYEEFVPWIEKFVEDMFLLQGNYPADGLVLEVNDHAYQSEINAQYDERQVAVKFGPWSPSMYRGKIAKILIEQRRVLCSCRVMIEPIVTDDGCQATFINTFNPSFLIEDDLKIGSEVLFERNAGTVNILVNGKKIKIESLESE